MESLGREVRTPADDAAVIDPHFVRRPECDDLRTHLDTEARKIVPGAVGPFDVCILERRIRPGAADVALHRGDVAADSAVDAVLGDDDPARHACRLA